MREPSCSCAVPINANSGYSDKERADDERNVEKLYKDITNGMLRRKRGADYDLSDSEDDGEARRRMKRKEFAKMRKALLEDERIGKIAENPKRLAFLQAIEDRENDDEVDFLDHFDDSQEVFESQSQSQDVDEREDVWKKDNSMGPPKRKHDDASYDVENRPPPHLRRVKGSKRPSNLSEIRQSLSSLIEAPNALAAESSDSDSDLEIGNAPASDEEESQQGHATKQHERDPFSRRRTTIQVIDRIDLKRSASSNVSTSTRLAFAAPSLASAGSFKVPALLRRATTNMSISSVGSAATELSAGGFGTDAPVKTKASKSSGVNYFAREAERREKVAEGERKREARRFKGAEERRKAVKGLFGGGGFE